MIRSGKIADERRELFFESLISVKLCAVIKRNGFELSAVLFYSRNTGGINILNSTGRNLLNDNEAGLSFDKGNNTVFPVTADNSVTFPVSLLAAVINIAGTGRNRSFTGKTASGIICIITFSASFGDDTQMLVKRTAFSFIDEKILINSFMAD